MWIKKSRRQYDRSKLRYPSDLTDEEWAAIEPHLPPPRSKRAKAPPERRDILNAILYVFSMGCQWRALPKDFPPKSTTYDCFVVWQVDQTLTRIHHALHGELRELEGRATTPTLSIVHSQSVGSSSEHLGGSAVVAVSPRTSKIAASGGLSYPHPPPYNRRISI
jgi:transposase